MYPLAFIGLHRATHAGKKIGFVEILDGAILGIGLSAVGSAFFITPVLPHFRGNVANTFFAVLFPIADLVLAALVLSLALLSPYSARSILLCVGVAIFALADFVFLGMNIRSSYTLGSITDDLWLLGLVIVAEALQHRNSKQVKRESLHPLFIALTVMMCATLLAILNLRPNYLPHFVAFPAITTLVLAFARMTMALKEASSLGEERLLARTDELTGLPNRRKFLAELASLNQNTLTPTALLLMDLDGFKPINDHHGHEIGDDLLREVTKRFSRAIPHGSILARLGGDEFGAIVHGEHESTLEVALALRATLSYPFSIAEREIMIDVSIGHVMNDGSSNLLRRADLAMYQAKRERVGVWSE
jgi:diguanylate cyclase (GGDEF)-like protein